MKNLTHIFFLGDMAGKTGPSIANISFAKQFSSVYDVTTSVKDTICSRILETIGKTIKCDIVFIGSKSFLNIGCILIAKLLRKKIIYILHGYASFECRINRPNISPKEFRKVQRYDYFIFKTVDRIVCVSKFQMEYMRSELGTFAEKFDYVFNVVPQMNVCEKKRNENEIKRVLSVGGGSKQKNILILAEALSGLEVSLIVVGGVAQDGDRIKKFENVTWIDYLPHEELLELMTTVDLYVQNSVFETFGLTIIEALYAGCNLLISNSVGCKDLFCSICDKDKIYDVFDTTEIREKTLKLLQEDNNSRLLSGFQSNLISEKSQIDNLIRIINSL